MCRLLGYAGRSTSLHHELMEADNSLLRQSLCDKDVCRPNDDGWGCGFDKGETLAVTKSATAPKNDLQFSAMAHAAYSRAFFHIRRASVGNASEDNTHPWQLGNYLLFAHNGSVYGFDSFREEAMRALPALLRVRIKGETDSEFAMYLLIDRLNQRGGPKTNDLDVYRSALGETVSMLEQWTEKSGETRKPKLNFMMLTPYHLIATRVIHTLGYYSGRQDGVLITSEALAENDGWQPMESHTMIAVDREAKMQIFNLN